jgi:Coenzyme PQQ synthesis protein D (PqqD)
MLRYVRSDSVVSRVIAGETLIVPVRKGVGDLASIYSLNQVGTSVWQAVASARTKSEIVEILEREFDGGCSRIEHDLDSFLAELCSAGLLVASEAAA